MFAIISDNDEYKSSLDRYLHLPENDSKGKIFTFGLKNTKLADLERFDKVFIHLPRVADNGIDHYGLTFCIALLTVFENKTVYAHCIDKPDHLFPIRTGSNAYYIKGPLLLDDLDNVINGKNDVSYIPISLPELPKKFSFDYPPIQGSHHSAFSNLLNSVSLLIGAALCGELDRLTAAESILEIINQYLLTQGDFDESERQQIHERISVLRKSEKPNVALSLRDYVYNKKIVLIDDLHSVGWGKAIARLFYPNGFKTENLGDLDIYKDINSSGILICASDPKKGSEFLIANGNEIGLVILDLYFERHELRGFNCLEEIRKIKVSGEKNKIPILIFSASFGSTTIIEVLEKRSAEAYFCKTIEEVAQKVQNTPEEKRLKENLYEETLNEYFYQFRKAVSHSLEKRIVRFRSKSELEVHKEVQRWLGQFPLDTRKYALRILENIDFYDTPRIKKLCRKVHSNLPEEVKYCDPKKIFYVGIGNPAKSGAHILYYYRQEIFEQFNLPKPTFLSLYEFKYHLEEDRGVKPENFREFLLDGKIILIDDFVGSGTQFGEEYKKIKKYLDFLGDEDFHNLVFYVSLLAPKRGLINIVKNDSSMKGRIISGKIFEEEDNAFSDYIFPDRNEKLDAQEKIRKISIDRKLFIEKIDVCNNEFCDVCTSQQKEKVILDTGEEKEVAIRKSKCKSSSAKLDIISPFGKKGQALLIAFEHNTPHNSLPILWSEEDRWFPLFKRIKPSMGV